ncbi:MotA/TolQ/ExbB proton channel [Desulforamulus reducens MI-1]|uniref:MotA/TolQ/ExbB proton channel n=1 Tax=Desulforamulus reducens (strain ATCC BAA-1160 / DSM 100696 / MI-1) TaxID=349161 RepID=A4J1F0_DESRM|nr:flagellar motor stator protein MotA [Desulforamulus reducens]ABO48903.1 MotA/TolQ/ExbB proton channel [Desulforamulus reducens MI-1]
MEKSTIIGLFLGITAISVGMVLKGAHLSSLWNPAAIMIIFVGTAASLFIAFPMSELKKIPRLLKITLQEPKLMAKREVVNTFVALASTARREGLLSLESQLESIDDPYLRGGMQMIIDGSDAEFVKFVMEEEIYATEERHRSGALIFTQAGTYAPTLGVLGAVVGLIAALGNLSDIEKLGHSIAAAFVATLLGIFSGYVLWHPIANKLKRISKKEMEIKQMIVEGVLAIQTGRSPIAIEQQLLVYLSPSERSSSKEEAENDGKAQRAA